ncbi:MAG: ABC transporter ATP-binding protein [Wenzhouxiangella sp.]|jgi:cobalt/nickel transport system ATP-binding protein|nr:ABC transporter ATP-binding protein [Wenzhouxiangella sp.]
MIEIEQVSFHYPEGRIILDKVSFRLEPEERVVLLGANGCGKSSLLKLIDGLLDPTGGEIRYQGETLSASRLRQREFALRFRRDVGMVFQSPEAMLFNATVAEEIAYGPERLGMPEPDAVARRWAERLQLEKYLDTPPYRLSGGEKQRLALACVLACQPRLLLLDEPTANLDPRATGWLVDFLLDQKGLTTLVTTQNLSLAAELGQRALILGEDGHLLYDGSLATALADTDLLWRANLAHAHRHVHADGTEHRHVHAHGDWG